MTDLEITRLCAEAIGEKFVMKEGRIFHMWTPYRPLEDDAQAMALVKKFQMLVRWDGGVHGWTAGCWYEGSKGQAIWTDWTAQDLNRAICECVARLQQAKAKAPA